MEKQKGFSLLELIIVLVMIVLLTVIALPSYRYYLKQGRASTAQSDLLVLSANLELFRLSRESILYSGANASDIYSDTSPLNSSNPDFKLEITLLNDDSNYLLSAKSISGSVAENDGVYWFNPKGRNCYFEKAGTSYNSECTNGKEWY